MPLAWSWEVETRPGRHGALCRQWLALLSKSLFGLANVVAALAHKASSRVLTGARRRDQKRGPRVQKSQHSLMTSCECAYGLALGRQFAAGVLKVEKNEQSICRRGGSPGLWIHLAAPAAWPLPACDFFRLHGNPKSSAACSPSTGSDRTGSTGRASSAQHALVSTPPRRATRAVAARSTPRARGYARRSRRQR